MRKAGGAIFPTRGQGHVIVIIGRPVAAIILRTRPEPGGRGPPYKLLSPSRSLANKWVPKQALGNQD